MVSQLLDQTRSPAGTCRHTPSREATNSRVVIPAPLPRPALSLPRAQAHPPGLGPSCPAGPASAVPQSGEHQTRTHPAPAPSPRPPGPCAGHSPARLRPGAPGPRIPTAPARPTARGESSLAPALVGPPPRSLGVRAPLAGGTRAAAGPGPRTRREAASRTKCVPCRARGGAW